MQFEYSFFLVYENLEVHGLILSDDDEFMGKSILFLGFTK